jgi:hypothetical protein
MPQLTTTKMMPTPSLATKACRASAPTLASSPTTSSCWRSPGSSTPQRWANSHVASSPTALTAWRVDSIDGLRARLAQLRDEIKAPATAKEFYVFIFGLLMQNEGQRSLSVDEACAMWSLVFDKWPLLADWNNFIQTQYKKAISRDVWNMLFDFTQTDVDKARRERLLASVDRRVCRMGSRA